MRESLRVYLEHEATPFAQLLREWWTLRNQGRPTIEIERRFTTHLQKAFLHLVERGLQGQPTLEHLHTLEKEIEMAAQLELEMHLTTLPFKVLLPLLLFQFPAYLILLLGPLLRDLNRQLGGG